MSIATAQTLCQDVLHLIFLHALPIRLHHRYDGPADISAIEPMNFYLVCRSWRAAVLSHPNLWGRVAVESGGHLALDNMYHRVFLEWVQRSQTSNLDILLELYYLEDEPNTLLKETINLVLAQQSRLERFDISVREVEGKEWQAFTLRVSPVLISLNLKFPIFYSPNKLDFAASLDLTSSAVSTNLSVLIVDQHVRWILPSQRRRTLHFPSLCELEICTDINGNFDDFHAVLSACPNIVRLRVEARRCAPPTTTAAEMILLPHLDNLYVGSEENAPTLNLLSRITCTSLRELLVYAPGPTFSGDDPEPHRLSLSLLHVYQDFFARSRPPLSNLALLYWVTPPSEARHLGYGSIIRRILRPLRMMQSLTLTDVVVDSELFEEMTFQDGDDSAICPLLTDILIRYNEDLDNEALHVRQESVNTMVASRMRRNPNMKKIELGLPGCEKVDYHAER